MRHTTRIRLFQAQRQIGLNTPVFLAPAEVLTTWKLNGNLNYFILTELKAQLYSFNHTRLLDSWTEIHDSLLLNMLFQDILRNYDLPEANKIQKLFLQRSVGQRFLSSINQLLTLDNQLLT